MDLTEPHALYRIHGVDDGLLYVGISCGPATRFASHQRGKPWWQDVASISVEHFDDRASALKAEDFAIDHEHPRYNVRRGGSDGPTLQRLREMAAEREEALRDERATIIQAGLDGYRQAEVARAIGRSREHIRQVWDAHERDTGVKLPVRRD